MRMKKKQEASIKLNKNKHRIQFFFFFANSYWNDKVNSPAQIISATSIILHRSPISQWSRTCELNEKEGKTSQQQKECHGNMTNMGTGCWGVDYPVVSWLHRPEHISVPCCSGEHHDLMAIEKWLLCSRAGSLETNNKTMTSCQQDQLFQPHFFSKARECLKLIVFLLQKQGVSV